jgi:glycosyltransferase involved in cell wall biosynthesis
LIINRCIIIPSYNEEKNIASVIEDVRKCHNGDIVVIDDGSQDRTSAVARSAGAVVIRHPFNMGYGVALQTGYKYAAAQGYAYLVQIDGDGQHDSASIPALFAHCESHGCDVVIGSRFLIKGSGYDIGWQKKTGVFLFQQIIRLVSGEKITDPTSGYQCLNRKTFSYFTGDIFPTDYPDANIIILLHRMGFHIEEIPVNMQPNLDGRSMHAGILKLTYYFFKVFLSIFVTLMKKRA